MARFSIVIRTGRSAETLTVEADAYKPEGPMTSFFVLEPGRQVIDCWSERVASFRTAELARVLRVSEAAAT